MKNTKPALVLLIILFVASFLRLYKIDKIPVSLFGDELDAGYHAYSILKTGKDYTGHPWPLHFQSLAERRTPLYLYSAVPTVALFGVSPLGVRLPAALFGIASIFVLYLLTKELTNKRSIAIIAAIVLTLSPWHIQYSRAGFEVTELLFFTLTGLFLFFYALRNKGKFLWASGASFAVTFWIYNTSKLFIPLLLIFLFFFYIKQILKLPKKTIAIAIVTLVIVSAPMIYDTLFGGSASRFDYISIFSENIPETEIAELRNVDAKVRLDEGKLVSPSIMDRVFHNKFGIWAEEVAQNYLKSYSFDFLFDKGDTNQRHSILNTGEFYKVEIIALIIGIIYFFGQKENSRGLIIFWLLAGALPSELTSDGAHHATRLILILPPLVILIAMGIYKLAKTKTKKVSWLLVYAIILGISFISYQHQYWIHNPEDSAKWWHYGFEQAIGYLKQNDKDYDKVIISTADEPPWIFFAAWYQYPPDKWQQGYPFKKTNIKGFGEISYIGKYYFGSPNVAGGVYGWGSVLDDKTLYVATAKEVNVNLIAEPDRTPKDIKILKAISYPSGAPAFYVFQKNTEAK